MMTITTITTMRSEIMSYTHPMGTMRCHTTVNGTPDILHTLMDMMVILVAMMVILVAMIIILITTPLNPITRIQFITASMQMA